MSGSGVGTLCELGLWDLESIEADLVQKKHKTNNKVMKRRLKKKGVMVKTKKESVREMDW